MIVLKIVVFPKSNHTAETFLTHLILLRIFIDDSVGNAAKFSQKKNWRQPGRLYKMRDEIELLMYSSGKYEIN
jgi:hypothetical protein